MCFANVPLGGLIFWKCVEVEVERRMWMALSLPPVPSSAGFKQAISVCCSTWNEKLFTSGDDDDGFWSRRGFQVIASPSFDRLWGARRRRFADSLTITVNWPEWFNFKWNTSVTAEGVSRLLRKSQVATLSAVLNVVNYLLFPLQELAFIQERPRYVSTKMFLGNASLVGGWVFSDSLEFLRSGSVSFTTPISGTHVGGAKCWTQSEPEKKVQQEHKKLQEQRSDTGSPAQCYQNNFLEQLFVPR